MHPVVVWPNGGIMADTLVVVARGVLILMRLIVFALSLGITVISFQSYRELQTDRLQYAFIGFAFISMGVAVGNVFTQFGAVAATSEFVQLFFQTTETIPFMVGFAALYVSLYR
jgi:hypothetical protein